MNLWFLKNAKLVEALTTKRAEFPILNMYMQGAQVEGDIILQIGENAGYAIDDYFFNERREADKLSEFLGEGWDIHRVCRDINIEAWYNFLTKD